MVSPKVLQDAIKLELPALVLDDDTLAHLVGAWDSQAGADEAIIEEWYPFIIANAQAHDVPDDDAARELCRRVVKRLQKGLAATPGPDSAATSGARAPEEVHGLAEWLRKLRLDKYHPAALKWCEKVGAVGVDEVMDNWKAFSEELGLKVLEKKRVQTECENRSAAALAELAAEAPSPDPEPAPAAPQCNIASLAEYDGFGPPDNKKKYIILESIGKGATATVFKCIRGSDVEKGRGAAHTFAAKIISLVELRLRVANWDRMLEKLRRESAFLFALQHQNIVALHDVVETDEKLYLVMEFVEGGDLLDRINAKEGLTEKQARFVFSQLVDALKYIHQKGIVHRDLKPENILVDGRASRDGLPRVKITDFGHSKLVDDGYSTAITQVGTPQYWAPEVSDPRMCAKGYNQLADLWSLGVVLYVMLEGVYPFDRQGADRRGEQSARRGEDLQFKSCSTPARDLIKSLIKVRPNDRLALEKCCKHQWVRTGDFTLPERDSNPRGVVEDVERFPFHADAKQFRELRSDLNIWGTRFRSSAVPQRGEVVVTWATSPDFNKHEARSELLRLLAEHGHARPHAG